MKSNGATLTNILKTDQELGNFALVKLEWNAIHYLTSLPYGVTWNGNYYKSDETIMDVEGPRYSTTIDREAYALFLNGQDELLHSEVAAGIIHKPVEIRLGFTLDGVPLLGLDETLHVYSGTVASPKFAAKDEEMIWRIECSAPLSNLDARSTLFTTKDAMENLHPGDTCFDKIQENSDATSVAWGKEK